MENPHPPTNAPDADTVRRPGIPEERTPRQAAGSAHWLEPEKQLPSAGVLKDLGRDSMTATFGTGQPPRGLSGVMRRAAYRMPDYEGRRWALLFLADRVDAVETWARELVTRPPAWHVAGIEDRPGAEKPRGDKSAAR